MADKEIIEEKPPRILCSKVGCGKPAEYTPSVRVKRTAHEGIMFNLPLCHECSKEITVRMLIHPIQSFPRFQKLLKMRGFFVISLDDLELKWYELDSPEVKRFLTILKNQALNNEKPPKA